MEGKAFDASEDQHGNIELIRLSDNRTVFLQGDDAGIFRADWDKVLAIWARRFGKGYRKSYGPFKSYNEHIDSLIEPYF